MKNLPLAVSALLIASPTFADVRVQFVEGAPKDTFIIINEGGCDIGPSELVIDFSRTSAGLIFDVSGAGAGLEVFQPFEVTQGASLLASLPTISDGDQIAILRMKGLGAALKIAFTIDVDDTRGARAITVSDDEISGAVVSLAADGKRVSAFLGDNAEVILPTGPCTS
jgi:hypothetical protein